MKAPLERDAPERFRDAISPTHQNLRRRKKARLSKVMGKLGTDAFLEVLQTSGEH